MQDPRQQRQQPQLLIHGCSNSQRISPFEQGLPPAAKSGGRGSKAKRYILFTNSTAAATRLRSETGRTIYRPCRGQVNITWRVLLGNKMPAHIGIGGRHWSHAKVTPTLRGVRMVSWHIKTLGKNGDMSLNDLTLKSTINNTKSSWWVVQSKPLGNGW